MRRVAVLLATAFGIGYLPVAPATWASFAAAAFFAAVPGALDPPLLGAAVVVLIATGIPIAGAAERALGTDARPIVIDEIAGMAIAVWGVAAAAAHPLSLLALAFVLFRILDILKPWPISRFQDLPGGWGVMADDVAAGIATNLLLRAAAALGVPL